MTEKTSKAPSNATDNSPVTFNIRIALIYKGIRHQCLQLQFNGENENIRKDAIGDLCRYAMQLELLDMYYRMDYVKRNIPDFKVTVEKINKGGLI